MKVCIAPCYLTPWLCSEAFLSQELLHTWVMVGVEGQMPSVCGEADWVYREVHCVGLGLLG